MLGYILEKATALVSSSYDVVADVAEYVYEDVKSIPDAIEKGWSEGLMPEAPKTEATTAEETATPVEETTEQ